MSKPLNEAIAEAIQLLQQEAEVIKASACNAAGQWDDEPEAERSYHRYMLAAANLHGAVIRAPAPIAWRLSVPGVPELQSWFSDSKPEQMTWGFNDIPLSAEPLFSAPQPKPRLRAMIEQLGQERRRSLDAEARIAELERIAEDQRLALVALNIEVGGEGSTTTENLTRIGRLEIERDELRQHKDADLQSLRDHCKELERVIEVLLRDYSAVHGDGDLEMQPALNQARAAVQKPAKSLRDMTDADFAEALNIGVKP